MKNTVLPKKSESFWHKTSQVKNYGKLEKDISVDVAVIGGGIAGILSAYELTKRGKKVALFEARTLIYGTTGFTTSKLSAQHNIIYHELIERYGEEKARRYYDANLEGMGKIIKIAKEHQIQCELKEQNAYVYTQEKSQVNHFEKEAKAYEKLFIDGRMVKELPINLDIEAGLVMHNQYEFHPVMFLSGVLMELENMGTLIYENTLVKEITPGDSVYLKTEDGNSITCQQAICASHYPLDDPDKFYTDHMEPEISFARIYEFNQKYQGGMYISYDNPRRTFRLVDANGKKYLLVGGENHRLGTGTSDLERYNTIVDFAKKTFGVDQAISKWSSHDYLTKDRMPFVGLSSKERRNIYVVTGLSKWGLCNAAIASEILADMIEEKKNLYEEMFKPYREIPKIDGLDSEESKQNYPTSTPKSKVEELEKREALIVEKDDEKFGAYKDDDGNLHYLNLACTHLGCGLGFNDGDQTWDCKCHGSRFMATGEVIEGPAMEDLDKVNQDKIKY